MSDTTNLTKSQRNIYSFLYAAVYIIASVTAICAVGGIVYSPLLAPICYLVSVLGLSSLFMSAGKKWLYVLAFPAIALCAYAFKFGDLQNSLICALDCVSAVTVSACIYFLYKKGERKSVICALGSASALVFEIISVATSVAFAAVKGSMKFGTVLFNTFDEIIQSYINMYIGLLENMAKISPELYAQTPQVNTDMLYTSFTLIIALMPALIYCIYFFVTFASCTLADISNKKHGFIPDRRFANYDISEITNVIFTIFGTILIFTLLFGSELSGFTLGVLSVVIVILPHFVVFGYKRIYRICERLCGKGGAILLILVLSVAACIFALQFFLFLLAFFGTSEYRMAKFEKRLKR